MIRNHRRVAVTITVIAAASCLLSATAARAQQLPPVPQPAENRVTEAKRVLGKILFWEEQLSSDNTMACGTCHVPGSGGADPRVAINPGPDEIRGTADDIRGSFGVAHRDADGQPVSDPVYGFDRQVTGRAAPSFFASLYARETFWDGRASSVFTDPLDPDSVLIADRGALESQSVGPILNRVEMAREGRTWADVVAKLEAARPLRYADDVPADAAAAIATAPGYPQLFAAAFGDDAITPARIAFSIASYERTLLPGQTPWDRFIAGDTTAMTPAQQQGWNLFRSNAAQCSHCHVPPLFTNNDFVNVGLRPASEDQGRLAISGLDEDFGDMKMPGLRNVGLRATLMHTGRITGVPDVLDFYTQARGHAFFTANQDTIPPNNTPLSAIRIAPQDRAPLVDFLANALTDPRVAAETFPFDRPSLASEAPAGIARCSDVVREDCKASLTTGRAPISIVAAGDTSAIKWKLGGIEATDAAEFGDPTAADGAVLCLYDGDAPGALVFEARAPAGEDCSDGGCWRSIGASGAPSGFRYVSSSGSLDGVRRIKLVSGADGAAKISAVLSGPGIATSPFGIPGLPAALPLVVQLQSGAGSCWSATYASADAQSAGGLSAR